MRRDQLEHAIRAATEIVRQDSVLVIGSQAVLGTWDEDELPGEAIASLEVDICPLEDDAAETMATTLDALIGEWSSFHQTHGFYIQGVGRRTALLPVGWDNRLVRVNGPGTHGRTGLCLDPHDLCLAKLAAGREKDRTFVAALVTAGRVNPLVLAERADDLDVADPRIVEAVKVGIRQVERLSDR